MELKHLPDELFHVIFGYFTVPTLLTTCALVCKRWMELIHQMRIKELRFEFVVESNSGCKYVVSNSLGLYQPSYPNFWGHPPVSADPRYSIRMHRSNSPFFEFPFIKMFEHLKRLKLSWILTRDFDFNKLNELSALEELEAQIRFDAPTEKILKLPRLRLLILTFNAVHRSKLTVDCPVKVLFIHYDPIREFRENRDHQDEENPMPRPASSLQPFNLVYPETLEEIIPSKEAQRLNFSACKNVRICRDHQHLDAFLTLNQSDVFTTNHLEIFPNLEELHYQSNFYGPRDDDLLGDLMNATQGRISAALRQKKLQNRKVKIFFQGIQLESERFLESFHLKDIHELQIEHYDLLATNLYYYDKIDYSSLEKHLGDSLPADLFSKFTCVNTVTATGAIKHLDQFATFLRQCKYLCQLEVEIDLVDQNFCDQLHVNCFFLKKLVFIDCKKEDDLANAVGRKLTISDRPFKKLNFDFLAKQINLVDFIIDEFDMEIALRCLRIHPSQLQSFSFLYFNERIWITISKTNQPYTLDASLSSFKHAISISSKSISIDELSLDLEYLKKKIELKLALVPKN